MSELIDVESTKYVGERGPDKQPREFNPKSLSNLKQFQTIPKANSGFNWLKIGIVLVSTIIASFAIWKIWNMKEKTK